MRKRILRIGTRLILSLVAAAGLLAAAVELVPCPGLNDDLSFSRKIVDRNGEWMRLSLAADGRYRLRTRLEELPGGLVDAVLLHEDAEFYRHAGVDAAAICRAAFQRLAGQSRSGASTITMQLARMRFAIDSASVLGKLAQAFRAMQLERRFSKKELLESYLNRVAYSGNIEGIGAASWIYFGKTPAELSQAECDALALIPQRPSRRSPVESLEAEDLRKARQRLSKRRSGKEEEIAPLCFRKNLPFAAPHLAMRIEQSHPKEDVTTTVDLKFQRIIETEIRSYLSAVKRKGVRNASALLVDYRSGEVLSYVGSADYASEVIDGQVDGVRMQRSPGSTIKPFVYALALQEGIIHPGSLLSDVPMSLSTYEPGNFDKTFHGRLTVEEALVRSRNIPAVVLASKLRSSTRERFLDLAAANREGLGAGFAIGGMETSMEKLAGLWCALANLGAAPAVHYVRDSRPENTERWFTPEASYLILQMLASEANEHPLKPKGLAIAWKTGTSQGFRDAWCCAVFDRYVLCVWLGSFDGRSNPALVGRDMAAPLLFRLAQRIAEIGPGEPAWTRLPEGANLVQAKVCRETGCLAGEKCRSVRESWYWPGVSPVRVCSGRHSGAGEEMMAEERLEITSPVHGVTYVAERKGQAERGIPLRAGGADSRLYWLDGERILGSTEGKGTLWWRPAPGAYRLTVMDEEGRSTSREVVVAGL